VEPLDEEHAWICVSVGDAENAWVRRVTAKKFVSSCVWVTNTAPRGDGRGLRERGAGFRKSAAGGA